MNKRLIIALVAIAAVILAVWWWMGMMVSKQAAPTIAETTTAVYSDGATTVEASFDTVAGTVTFTHPAVGTVTLPQAISASGARYANDDESIVFWEHQGEATITKDGAEVFVGKIQDEATADEQGITGQWAWERSADSTGAIVTPTESTVFTITFNADGSIAGTTDCNNFMGSYVATEDGVIGISPLATTKMACPSGSQEADFTTALSQAFRYDLSQPGELILDINEGNGVVYLKRI